MLKKYVFTIKAPEGGAPIDFQIGSVMQGILMDHLPDSLCQRLHTQALRPYSQYVEGDGQEVSWHLHALRDDMVEAFDSLWEQWEKASLVSAQKGVTYTIEHKEIGETITYKDLCKKYFMTMEPARFVDVFIKTPISFKSNGLYLNWPDLTLLVRNLYKRWNAFSDDIIFDDRDILEFLQHSVSLGFYKLNSTRFDLEGTYIPAAQGQFSIRLTGNDMAKRWLGLLLEFAMYSGIGVKTAMGMGGVEVRSHYGRNNKK